MSTATQFDTRALRDAIEHRDADRVLALYRPDATIEMTDEEHGPSAPARLTGRDEIAAMLRDVYGRDMEHRVETVAAGEDAVGYTVRCAYPDGTLVRCVSIAELDREGHIRKEVMTQAWDKG
jgi:hypothetical protein